MQKKITSNPISKDQEKNQRQLNVDFSRRSVRLEGFILGAESEALNLKYIEGKISSKKLSAETIKLHKSNNHASDNLLGITDEDEFDIAEGEISSARILELIDNPIQGKFNKSHLQAFHQFIFRDIYSHAGVFHTNQGLRSKIRKMEGPGPTYVVSYPPIGVSEKYLDDFLNEFSDVKNFMSFDLNSFSEKITSLYCELDFMHVFNDGNSRTLRSFTRQLALESGFILDWGQKHVDSKDRDSLYKARDIEVLKKMTPYFQTENQIIKKSMVVKKLEDAEPINSIISNHLVKLLNKINFYDLHCKE
jgi:fido (protein-threonine AMPylation protein)